MKRSFFSSFLLLLIVSFTVFAVTDHTKEPKAVAVAFSNALRAKDYNKAKKYGTEATIRVIEMLQVESIIDSTNVKTKAPKITTKILEANIDGNQCHIRFETSDLQGEEQTMTLTKTNEKWLVEMTKDDMEE
jgi:hypothetical protein